MRRYARNALLAIFFLLTGCSAHGSISGASVTSSPASAAATSPAPPEAAPASVSSIAPAPSSTDPSATLPVPVLGESRSITQGYGSVRPGTVYNGGDPTGKVTDVSWTSWGGAEAIGSGMAYYDPPNVPVSRSVKERATVVAFDPGTCGGRYMYQAIEWYFPESGGSFNPASYLNICSWTFHPSSGS